MHINVVPLYLLLSCFIYGTFQATEKPEQTKITEKQDGDGKKVQLNTRFFGLGNIIDHFFGGNQNNDRNGGNRPIFNQDDFARPSFNGHSSGEEGWNREFPNQRPPFRDQGSGRPQEGTWGQGNPGFSGVDSGFQNNDQEGFPGQSGPDEFPNQGSDFQRPEFQDPQNVDGWNQNPGNPDFDQQGINNRPFNQFPGGNNMNQDPSFTPNQNQWGNNNPGNSGPINFPRQPQNTGNPNWQNQQNLGNDQSSSNTNLPDNQEEITDDLKPNDLSFLNISNNESQNLPLDGNISENNEKVAILGYPVIVTSTTLAPGTITFNDTATQTPFQKQCVQDCRTTSEYIPICGSNNVTYFNPARFMCARNCGINVFIKHKGRCPRF